jgi:hypothetical protein
MNLLEEIFHYKDLFYCLLEFLNYEDFVNLSTLDKNFYQKIKLYKKSSCFQKLFSTKFRQKKSKCISISPLENYTYFWDNRNILPIFKKDFRNIFIENQFFVSDIIRFYHQYFILDSDKIYTCSFLEDLFLPQKVIEKYGISRYENIKYLNAFIHLSLPDFDFHNLMLYSEDDIIFVKIWNTRYQTYIFTYLFHHINNKIVNSAEIKNNLETKIKEITNYVNYNYNNLYFYKNGQTRIITHTINSNPNISGWFLE